MKGCVHDEGVHDGTAFLDILRSMAPKREQL